LIQFGRLLNFSKSFDHLKSKLAELPIEEIQARQLSSGVILVAAMVNEHEVNITIQGPKLAVNRDIKCFCDCESFKFDHAYSLYKQGSLLHADRFVLKPPHKKNVNLEISGCKHIVLVAQTLWKNRDIIK